MPPRLRHTLLVSSIASLALAAPAFSATLSWTGAAAATWNNFGDWASGTIPATGDDISFDSNSTTSLATTLDAAFNINSLTVTSPTGAVSIANGTSGSLTIGAGGINMSAATQNLTFSNTIGIGASQTWNVASAETLTFNLASNTTFNLGGNVVTKSGTGILAFNGANISNGTLELAGGADTLYGFSSLNCGIAATGTIQIDTGASLTTAGSSGKFTLSGTMALNGGTWTLNTLGGSGAHVLNGTVTVNSAGTISQTSTGTQNVANLASTIQGTGTLTLNSAAGGINSTGLIQNSGGTLAILVSGSNITIANASNTYSGGTTVSGTLKVGAAGSLGTGTLTLNNGSTLESNGTTAVTISNALNLQSGAVYTFNLGSSTNTGTLTFTAGTALGGYEKKLNVASVVEIDGSLTAGPGGTSNALTKLGSSTLILAGANTYSGVTTISAGTLQIGNGNATGKLGTGNVVDNATLAFNRSDAGLTVSNVISGTGAVDQIGSGTTTLSAASTYTGATNVNAGTLLVSGSLTGTSGVTVAGTLGGSGSIKPGTTGTIGISATGTIAPGGAATTGTLTLDHTTSTAATLLTAALGAQFTFKLNVASNDQLAITHGLGSDIAFNSNTLNFTDISGGLLSGQYTLFTDDAANGFSGLALDGGNNIVSGLSIGSAFLSAYPGSSLQEVGNNIVLTVVPEPTTVLSLIGGLGILVGWRRRKS